MLWNTDKGCLSHNRLHPKAQQLIIQMTFKSVLHIFTKETEYVVFTPCPIFLEKSELKIYEFIQNFVMLNHSLSVLGCASCDCVVVRLSL